jgi:hypothetical protein
MKLEIYNTIILPVILYGRGTCSVTLVEIYTLSVREYVVEEFVWVLEGNGNRVLKKTT